MHPFKPDWMLIFREYGAEPSRTNYHNGSSAWTSRTKEVESCSSVSASSTTLIQNLTICVVANFIVTSFKKCGFGCKAHHAAVALRLALAQHRTLYVDNNAWYDIFLPVAACSKPSVTACERYWGCRIRMDVWPPQATHSSRRLMCYRSTCAYHWNFRVRRLLISWMVLISIDHWNHCNAEKC